MAKNNKTKERKPQIQNKGLLIVVHQNTISQYQLLLNKFLKQTKAYKYSSNSMFFVACVTFLYEHLDINKNAPDSFVKYINRGGKRPKSDRSFPTNTTDKLFFRVEQKYYNMYVDLLYNFLIDRDDEVNPCYSISYFFYDFIELVQSNFDDIVRFYKK